MKKFIDVAWAWCFRKVHMVLGALTAFLPHTTNEKGKRWRYWGRLITRRIVMFGAVMLLASPIIPRFGGAAVRNKLIIQSFSGTYIEFDDGDGNRRVKFLTSGTLVVAKTVTVDICCVGAGGGAVGTVTSNYVHGCGGGGYVNTFSSIVLTAGVSYPVVVGAGGNADSDGGKTWAINETAIYANGGKKGLKSALGNVRSGGDGGSGGASQVIDHASVNGGTNGSDGATSYYGGYTFLGGIGQGSTTGEFGDAAATQYSMGGGVNSSVAANTGNGGRSIGGAGSSGICVIRNH